MNPRPVYLTAPDRPTLINQMDDASRGTNPPSSSLNPDYATLQSFRSRVDEIVQGRISRMPYAPTEAQLRKFERDGRIQANSERTEAGLRPVLAGPDWGARGGRP